MKKYDVIRKIKKDGVPEEEKIKAYLYTYQDVDFAIYNAKEYPSDFRGNGYISIIRTCNDMNGLSFHDGSYKTIKECYIKTLETIDKRYEQIIKIMEVK